MSTSTRASKRISYSGYRNSTSFNSDSLSSIDISKTMRGICSTEIIPRAKREFSTDSISTVSDTALSSQHESWFRLFASKIARGIYRKKQPAVCDGVVGLTEETSPSFASELVQICSALTFTPVGRTTRNWACDTATFDVPSIGRKAQLQVGFSLFDTTTFAGDKALLDEFCSHIEVNPAKVDKACPHLLAGLMLPEDHFPVEARKIAASFWLWLCLVDDQIESEGDARFNSLIDDVEALMDITKDASEIDGNEVSFRATRAFMLVLQNTSLSSEGKKNHSTGQNVWKQDLLTEIKAILNAFRNERPLMRLGQHMTSRSLMDWMRVRLVTISCRPFMVLAKASLRIPTSVDPLSAIPKQSSRKIIDSAKSPNFECLKLELLVQTVAGLQNDIIGWEKDHRQKNYMNCIEILRLRKVQKRAAFSTAVRTHNLAMHEMLGQVDEYSQGLVVQMQESGMKPEIDAEMRYLEALVGFTHGMAAWHSRAKRYV